MFHSIKQNFLLTGYFSQIYDVIVKNVYNEPEVLAEIPSESSKKDTVFA